VKACDTHTTMYTGEAGDGGGGGGGELTAPKYNTHTQYCVHLIPARTTSLFFS